MIPLSTGEACGQLSLLDHCPSVTPGGRIEEQWKAARTQRGHRAPGQQVMAPGNPYQSRERVHSQQMQLNMVTVGVPSADHLLVTRSDGKEAIGDHGRGTSMEMSPCSPG